MKVIETKETEDGGMLIAMDMSFDTMKAFAAIGVKMMLVAAAMEEIAESDAFEAADEIERLRAALEAVVRYAGNAGDDYLAEKARAALEGKHD